MRSLRSSPLGASTEGPCNSALDHRLPLPRRFPTLGPVGNGGRAVIGFGADLGSSFASADLGGASRGAWGNLSSSIARRTARVTAACSASEKSIVGIRFSFSPRATPAQENRRLTLPSLLRWMLLLLRGRGMMATPPYYAVWCPYLISGYLE